MTKYATARNSGGRAGLPDGRLLSRRVGIVRDELRGDESVRLCVFSLGDDTHPSGTRLLDAAEMGNRSPGKWKHRALARILFRAQGQVNARPRRSLQFGVLGLSLLQDGNVGVRVFPECEEIIVGGLRFCGVARESVGAGDAKVSECAEWVV